MRDITEEIIAYAREKGGRFHDWYAGITDDSKRRLFEHHKVPQESQYLCRDAGNISAARRIENDLLIEGFAGGGAGGSSSSHFIYAYRKIPGVTDP
jgi:hypothetical protein